LPVSIGPTRLERLPTSTYGFYVQCVCYRND